MIDRSAEAVCLPSIHAAYRRVEGYLEWLAGVDPQDPTSADGPGPLDALLLALFLDYHAERLTVVDLAAGATRGASTLICAGRPGVRAIRIDGPAEAGPRPLWRRALEDYLREVGPPDAAAILPMEAEGGEADRRPGPREGRAVLVHLGGLDRDEARRRLDAAMAVRGDGPVLAIGLGPTGRCEGIAALLRRRRDEPGLRLDLFRELTGVLGASGIALLAPDDAATAATLDRMAAFFSGNFDFLRLVEAHCRLAVAATQLDDQTRGRIQPAAARGGIDGERLVRLHLEAVRERDRLRAESDRLRADVDRLLGELWAREQEGLALRRALDASEADRLAAHARVERWSGAVIPEGSLRRLGYRKGRAAVRIWREDGLGGLVRHLARRAG